MARTISEIEQELSAQIASLVPNLSISTAAEWRLWQSIFARGIWVFENIMDLFRTEIENKVQSKQPGSFDWYSEKILEFQGETLNDGTFQGDTLLVKDGVITYETIDETRRIIKQRALRALQNALAVKVAKALDANNNTQLSDSEIQAFSVYMDNIKYPGTVVNIISLPADIILYDIEVVYDPIYNVATIQDNVIAKREEYRYSLGFDDRVYKGRIESALISAEGVISVKVNSIYITGVTSGQQALDVVLTLDSGYFNWDENSSFTFVNANTL
jgi:hypothetical protein